MNEHNQTVSVEPSVAILRMISGFRAARAIYIAAKLGIADLLKDEPKGSGELALATKTHASSLYPVMRALASAGIFAEDEKGRFMLTPIADTLRSDVPGSLRAWAILVLGEEHYEAWGDLMHSVRTGRAGLRACFRYGSVPIRSPASRTRQDL